jgi:hypothetical protein
VKLALFKIINKKGLFFILACSMFLLPAISLAQGPDCGDADPVGGTCPLDTWVIVLAVAATALAAFHLYRKQKSPLPVAKGIK